MAYIGVRVLKALRALHEHGAAAQLTDEEAGGVLAWPLAGPPCMARLLSGIMAGNYDCQAADFFAVLCSDVAELHTLGGGYEAALRSVQALVAPLLHGLMEAAERLALPAELQSSLPEAEAAGVVAQLVGAAVGASIAGLEYGLSWMQAKQPRPSPADGERLLAPSA
ncbi:hypothetical protein C2E20_6390 isoform A [Micractinium conductrix]|uniref:Uncharacterized protein n=1 Tax=Micractinium conductrix TaxID=554055 RepID=A0A2P6V7S7_9CHLO|nr:hypothetical protein C2E20_6390 isoform A [Micractinium conductrix]|eukprot:PSC70147.1 hypothetical protein C2E20_6390 isoform A [Micractinium conductrix]